MVALGRPRMDLLPLTDRSDWPYQMESEDVYVVFGSDGLVKEVDGSRKARGLLSPPAEAATAADAPAPAAASAPR